jgi:hypothetical protein
VYLFLCQTKILKQPFVPPIFIWIDKAGYVVKINFSAI